MPPLARWRARRLPTGAGWTWRSCARQAPCASACTGTAAREVVDLHTCLVLDPRLVALIGALRRVLQGVSGLRRTGSAVANLLDSGIDLLLRTDAPLSAADRTALTAMASGLGACRISSAVGVGLPEPAAQLAPAVTSLAGVEVAPPPGAFLQASRAGEAAIAAAVLAGLPERMPARARVVELFAGCGTLTFALAARARTQAYEGDPANFARIAPGRRGPPGRAGAAGPRPSAADRQGSYRRRRHRAGPAVCRRRAADAGGRRVGGCPGGLRELQPWRPRPRRACFAPSWLPGTAGDAGGSVPLVGCRGERGRVRARGVRQVRVWSYA